MWYAAHLMMYLEFQEEPQNIHPVWEEIYLIKADNADGAFKEADRIGAFNQEADQGVHTYGGRAVRWKYTGVRKLAECIDFEDGPPKSGKEVTYVYYYLEDKSDLDRMLQKKSVKLLLDGDDIT